MTAYNTSSAGLNAISSITNYNGTIMTVALMISTIIVLFVAFKFFRQCMLGGIVSGVGLLLYGLCNRITTEFQAGNTAPFDTYRAVTLFVVISFAVGVLLTRFDYFNNLINFEVVNDKEDEKVNKDGKKR